MAPCVLSRCVQALLCHLSGGQTGDGLEGKQVSAGPRMSPVYMPVFKILSAKDRAGID